MFWSPETIIRCFLTIKMWHMWLLKLRISMDPIVLSSKMRVKVIGASFCLQYVKSLVTY
jgi:hypothetical protein